MDDDQNTSQEDMQQAQVHPNDVAISDDNQALAKELDVDNQVKDEDTANPGDVDFGDEEEQPLGDEERTP